MQKDQMRPGEGPQKAVPSPPVSGQIDGQLRPPETGVGQEWVKPLQKAYVLNRGAVEDCAVRVFTELQMKDNLEFLKRVGVSLHQSNEAVAWLAGAGSVSDVPAQDRLPFASLSLIAVKDLKHRLMKLDSTGLDVKTWENHGSPADVKEKDRFTNDDNEKARWRIIDIAVNSWALSLGHAEKAGADAMMNLVISPTPGSPVEDFKRTLMDKAWRLSAPRKELRDTRAELDEREAAGQPKKRRPTSKSDLSLPLRKALSMNKGMKAGLCADACMNELKKGESLRQVVEVSDALADANEAAKKLAGEGKLASVSLAARMRFVGLAILAVEHRKKALNALPSTGLDIRTWEDHGSPRDIPRGESFTNEDKSEARWRIIDLTTNAAIIGRSHKNMMNALPVMDEILAPTPGSPVEDFKHAIIQKSLTFYR